jgi:hypothetical protein
MGKDLKEAFRLAMKERMDALGYSRNSDNVFARELLPGVLGCVGYLTSGQVLVSVRPFVGVRFEHLEKLVDEITAPLRVGPPSLSRYFPTIFRTLYELMEDRSSDPDFRSKEPAYIPIEYAKIPEITDRLVFLLSEFGVPYIGRNSSLENAAITMSEGRGGGLGPTAQRLPIIYWMLGRGDEAKKYMASLVGKGYPIGPYEKYVALVTKRIDAGPAPLPSYLH